MLWKADLSSYGEIIRKWWWLAKSAVIGRGSVTLGPVNASMVSISKPEVHGDVTSVEVQVIVSVKNDKLADLVSLKGVRVNDWASMCISRFDWPEIKSHGDSITVTWKEGIRPRVNIVGPDPTVAAVTINGDGTGTIGLTGGPDGAIQY